jgi:hypothetical protein
MTNKEVFFLVFEFDLMCHFKLRIVLVDLS